MNPSMPAAIKTKKSTEVKSFRLVAVTPSPKKEKPTATSATNNSTYSKMIVAFVAEIGGNTVFAQASDQESLQSSSPPDSLVLS